MRTSNINMYTYQTTYFCSHVQKVQDKNNTNIKTDEIVRFRMKSFHSLFAE